MKRVLTKRALMVVATLAVAASAGLVGPAKVASADTGATQCVQTESWTFSPALTTSVQQGTFAYTYSQTCATIDATTLVSGINSGSASFTGTYNGSCLTASLTGNPGSTGLMVGGVFAEFMSSNAVHYHVLIPADPCNDAGPTPGVSGTTFH